MTVWWFLLYNFFSQKKGCWILAQRQGIITDNWCLKVFGFCFIFKPSSAISELVNSVKEHSYVLELDFCLEWFLALHFPSQLVMSWAGLKCCSVVGSGQGRFRAGNQPQLRQFPLSFIAGDQESLIVRMKEI